MPKVVFHVHKTCILVRKYTSDFINETQVNVQGETADKSTIRGWIFSWNLTDEGK